MSRLAGTLLLLSLLLLTDYGPGWTVTAGPSSTYPPPLPADLVVTVRETAGVARDGEVVRSGVPLPRELDVRTTDQLAIVDSNGDPLPAEFEVLARWHAGLASDAPIQWLLVTFPATVEASGSATYWIVLDGSVQPAPAPETSLVLTQEGDVIEVDTGVARFRLGGAPGALFDEILLADGTLVTGGEMTVTVGGEERRHPTTRRVWVEHAGPLTAIVVVEGAYDLAPVGGGGLGSWRRYVFTAGSATAVIRQSLTWEGDRCGLGVLTCDGAPNGLLVEHARDTLGLAAAGPWSVLALGSLSSGEDGAVEGSEVADGETASIETLLRQRRTEPTVFEIDVAGQEQAGSTADGGLLAVGSDAGGLAVAVDHMHRYEPQALRLLENGELSIDVVDDNIWLGARQGLFATLAVSALSGRPERDALLGDVWAPLNHPLRAWPTPEWFAASGAVDEFPVGPLPPALADYDTLVEGTLEATARLTDEKGLAGLMTFGLYPRYWGSVLFGDELECGPNDPTPEATWDDLYWCGTWTDYHNTIATAPIWAMRSGEVDWLDEIATPGALRVLHTQVLRCAPDDGDFFCGQAPTGYGGYRADNNGSHAYFDNLFLYYWLTGDRTVVETLSRGAGTMRVYLCGRRPAEPCGPHDPPTDQWALLTGRVGSQWLSTFRFLGLAGDDPTYLEDYESGLARAVTQGYIEVEDDGEPYGFWLVGMAARDEGSATSDQLWMASLYDLNVLHRYLLDSQDAPLGDPAVRPSRVLAGWARTLARFGPTVGAGGNGGATGDWPNQFDLTWSGGRLGGRLESIEATPGGGDPLLYGTGKACLTAILARVGSATGDAAMLSLAGDLARAAIDAAFYEGSPLGKDVGLYLSRLHAAIALLADAEVAAGSPGAAPIPTATAEPAPTDEVMPAMVEPTPTGAERVVDVVRPVTPKATPSPAVDAVDDVAGVELVERDGSGVSGLAVIEPTADGTTVTVLLIGATSNHLLLVHPGTCASLEPVPDFLLAAVDATGRSETTLPVGQDELTASPRAIAVHASAGELGTIVACGELPMA
jgi:hypothetical protein